MSDFGDGGGSLIALAITISTSFAGITIFFAAVAIVMGVLAMFDVSAKVAQNDQNKDRVKKAKTLGIVCIVLSIIGCIAVNVAYYRNKGDDSSDSSKKQKAVKFAGIGGGVVIFVAAFVCGAMALAESGKLKKDFPKSPIVAAATA